MVTYILVGLSCMGSVLASGAGLTPPEPRVESHRSNPGEEASSQRNEERRRRMRRFLNRLKRSSEVRLEKWRVAQQRRRESPARARDTLAQLRTDALERSAAHAAGDDVLLKARVYVGTPLPVTQPERGWLGDTRKLTPGLRRCYLHRLRTANQEGGTVTLAFEVTVAGRVKKVEQVAGNLTDDSFLRCLGSVLTDHRFPRRDAAGPAVVAHWPLAFSPDLGW